MNTVRPGDVVVDMGTGSGILAMFAADAGASKVYAIEWDGMNFESLRKTFAINGYGEKIALIQDDVRNVKLTETVDVIIGEMIATGLIEELQVPAMNNLLGFVKDDYRVLLQTMENYAEPVYCNQKQYRKKMPIIGYEYPGLTKLAVKPLSPKVMYYRADFEKRIEDTQIDREIPFRIRGGEGAVINAVRISNKTIFWDGSSFGASDAYCYPILLPVDDMKVSAGDTVLLELSYTLCGGFSNLKYALHRI